MNHILAASTKMLLDLANMQFPDEVVPDADHIPASLVDKFNRALRDRTERFWPELWSGVEAGTELEQRSREILRDIRQYLQRFWREQDEHARDWYIHRAREYHQFHLLHPHTPSTRVESDPSRQRAIEDLKSALREFNSATEPEEIRSKVSRVNFFVKRALDEPPKRTPFELALFALQRRAAKPSTAPNYCRNVECKRPYFLASKKGQKFCTPECAHVSALASKREHWDINKARYNKKRRTK